MPIFNLIKNILSLGKKNRIIIDIKNDTPNLLLSVNSENIEELSILIEYVTYNNFIVDLAEQINHNLDIQDKMAVGKSLSIQHEINSNVPVVKPTSVFKNNEF